MNVHTLVAGAHGLSAMLRQNMRSGARRRVVILHTDRLPPALARPHHVRLAREALAGLAGADRAQSFELSCGRVAIVWRSRGDDEVALVRTALDHLLAGQPDGAAPALGELLTVYDLPDQAAWLLDEISAPDAVDAAEAPCTALDAGGLACLEARLGQADLSRFSRWRPVMWLGRPAPAIAWEERFFAVHDLAAVLCPGIAIKADPWLFRRLTRTLDHRMLAMLASPRELRGCGTFAINLNAGTILSADFLRFDEALPLALRGEVILNLRAADMLGDPAGFAFARRFAQARGYRLGLAGASLAMLRFIDLEAAQLDLVHLRFSAELMAGSAEIGALVPSRTRIVVCGLNRPSSADWAAAQGFALGRGTASPGGS